MANGHLTWAQTPRTLSMDTPPAQNPALPPNNEPSSPHPPLREPIAGQGPTRDPIKTTTGEDPLEWVVDTELLIPTHQPQLCAACHTWSVHARESMHHSPERFDRSRFAAAQDPRHEAERARQSLESRLDESRRLNGDSMDRVAAQAKECGKFKADNKALVKDFTEAAKDYSILQTQLARAREEA
ncbi:hypothetical protein BDV93DRAFT_566227 [Ceratobasidium sp. AG-I]|nr:hypothetical protein BDV93DRAFT_566227 [Ceratobasidium sp. AG-I]